MVSYTCSRCQKNYKDKTEYTRHINRKNPCKIISVKQIESSEHIQTSIEHIQTPIEHLILQTEKINEKEKHLCFYCKNEFINKSSLTRHTKLYCKTKKQHEKEKENKYNELIERIENNEKIFEEKIKELENKINNEQLKNQKLNQIINKQTNNIENTTNNIENQINNNITFNLIAYGREDMNKIDVEYILQALKRGTSAVPVITENIHFNSKYPEFHNVYISNMNQKYAMVYNGKDWILKDKNDTIDNLYENKYDFLEEKFEDIYNKLSNSQQESFKRFIKIQEKSENDKESLKIIKKIKQELKYLLYNKKNMPLENINKNTPEIIALN